MSPETLPVIMSVQLDANWGASYLLWPNAHTPLTPPLNETFSRMRLAPSTCKTTHDIDVYRLMCKNQIRNAVRIVDGLGS